MKNSLKVLAANKLSNVTGGVSLKEIRDTAIMATCTTIGLILGNTGAYVITTGINIENNHCKLSEVGDKSMIITDKRGDRNLLIGQLAGVTVGAAAGAAIGKKIVNALNKK